MLIRKPASYVRGLFSQRGNKKHVLLIGEGTVSVCSLLSGLAKDCRVTATDRDRMQCPKIAKLKYMNKGVKIIRQKYGDMSIEAILKALDIT